jgi:hypothetical protein
VVDLNLNGSVVRAWCDALFALSIALCVTAVLPSLIITVHGLATALVCNFSHYGFNFCNCIGKPIYCFSILSFL